MTIPPIIKRIYAEFSSDRIPAVAGGITFFFLLAVFPAITCVVSLYGLFSDRASIMKGLQMLSGFLPGGAMTVMTGQLQRLATQKPDSLGIAFAISLLIAIWSASGGVKALLDGLNIAFETKETRSFVRLTSNALLFTIVGAVTACIAIYLLVTVSHAIEQLPLATILNVLFDIVSWPLGFCICSILISVVYRYGPNRVHTPWKWITWGSATASTAWILGTMLFTWFVQHFGRYDKTYGDLGAAVGFLTWVWLSVVILLSGAEIICEVERKEDVLEAVTPCSR